MSLSGHILGAAPGVVPSCIPEHLPVQGGGWEGAGMQEKGGLHGNGNRAEPRSRYLSKWLSEHFGKQEGHCALPATLRPRITTSTSAQGEM